MADPPGAAPWDRHWSTLGRALGPPLGDPAMLAVTFIFELTSEFFLGDFLRCAGADASPRSARCLRKWPLGVSGGACGPAGASEADGL